VDRFEELPGELDIIAYCTRPDEATSARVALFLREHGYRAWALAGGYRAWRESGYPIDSKAAEMARLPDELCPECGYPWSDHAAA
jgi:rhodanese-related sulfurtransferase